MADECEYEYDGNGSYSCVLDTFDLDEQRAIFEKFGGASQTGADTLVDRREDEDEDRPQPQPPRKNHQEEEEEEELAAVPPPPALLNNDSFLDGQRALLEKFNSSVCQRNSSSLPAPSPQPPQEEDEHANDNANNNNASSFLLGDVDEDLVKEQTRILEEIQKSSSSTSTKLAMTELTSATSTSSTATTSASSSSSSSSRSLDVAEDSTSSRGARRRHDIDDGLCCEREQQQQRSALSSLSASWPAPRHAAASPTAPRWRRRMEVVQSMSKQESDYNWGGAARRSTSDGSVASSVAPAPPPATTPPSAKSSSAGGKLTVRCAGECGRKYMVSSKCKVLLCPRCDTLTPTSLGLLVE